MTLSRGRGPVLPLERGGQRQSAGFDLRTRPISSISRLVVLCPPLACLGLASRLARGPVAPVRCQADTSTCDHARERDSLSVSALFAPVRPISRPSRAASVDDPARRVRVPSIAQYCCGLLSHYPEMYIADPLKT